MLKDKAFDLLLESRPKRSQVADYVGATRELMDEYERLLAEQASSHEALMVESNKQMAASLEAGRKQLDQSFGFIKSLMPETKQESDEGK